MRDFTSYLQENSLYTTQKERDDLLKDEQAVSTAFWIGLLGTLGLFSISHKKGLMKTHFQDDENLTLRNIGDDNKDVSLVVKLMNEIGGIKGTVATQITRLLLKIKQKKITSKNLDETLVHQLISLINVDRKRPTTQVRQIVKDYQEAKVSLQQVAAEFFYLVKSKRKEYIPLAGEFYDIARQYQPLFTTVRQSTIAASVAVVDPASDAIDPATQQFAAPVTQQVAQPQQPQQPAQKATGYGNAIWNTPSVAGASVSMGNLQRGFQSFLQPTESPEQKWRKEEIAKHESYLKSDTKTNAMFVTYNMSAGYTSGDTKLRNMGTAKDFNEFWKAFAYAVAKGMGYKGELFAYMRKLFGADVDTGILDYVFTRDFSGNVRRWLFLSAFFEQPNLPVGSKAFDLLSVARYKDLQDMKGIYEKWFDSKTDEFIDFGLYDRVLGADDDFNKKIMAVPYNNINILDSTVVYHMLAEFRDSYLDEISVQNMNDAFVAKAVIGKYVLYFGGTDIKKELDEEFPYTVLKRRNLLHDIKMLLGLTFYDFDGVNFFTGVYPLLTKYASDIGGTFNYDGNTLIYGGFDLPDDYVKAFNTNGKWKLKSEIEGDDSVVDAMVNNIRLFSDKGVLTGISVTSFVDRLVQLQPKFKNINGFWGKVLNHADMTDGIMREFLKDLYSSYYSQAINNVRFTSSVKYLLQAIPKDKFDSLTSGMAQIAQNDYYRVYTNIIREYSSHRVLWEYLTVGLENKSRVVADIIENVAAFCVWDDHSYKTSMFFKSMAVGDLTRFLTREWFDRIKSTHYTGHITAATPLKNKSLWGAMDSAYYEKMGVKEEGELFIMLADFQASCAPDLVEDFKKYYAQFFSPEKTAAFLRSSMQVGKYDRFHMLFNLPEENKKELISDYEDLVLNDPSFMANKYHCGFIGKTVSSRKVMAEILGSVNPEVLKRIYTSAHTYTVDKHTIVKHMNGKMSKPILEAIISKYSIGTNNILNGKGFFEAVIGSEVAGEWTSDEILNFAKILGEGAKKYIEFDQQSKSNHPAAEIYQKVFQKMVDSKVPTKSMDSVFNELTDKLKKNVYEAVANNIVGDNIVGQIMNDKQVPINLIQPRDDALIRKILKFNDFSFKRAAFKSDKKFSDMIANPVKDLQLKKAVYKKVDMSEDELIKLSVDYDRKYNKYKHGGVCMEISEVFDVSIADHVSAWPTFQKKMEDEGIQSEIMDPVFHGTCDIAAAMIMRYGFEIIEGNVEGFTAGKMLGNGIYFTNVSDKASQYIGRGYKHGAGNIDNEGYVIEMRASLGKHKRDWREAGTKREYDEDKLSRILSPEWAVFHPKGQLVPYRVYKVKVIRKSIMDEWKKRYPEEGVNETVKEYDFKSFVSEAVYADRRNDDVWTFTFKDGKMPVSATEAIPFDEIKQKKLPKGVTATMSSKGLEVAITGAPSDSFTYCYFDIHDFVDGTNEAFRFYAKRFGIKD